jgi:FkbM family methyltransferase
MPARHESMDGASLYERWKAQWRKVERSSAAYWLKRHARMVTGRELRTFVEVRRPRRRYGGWTFDPSLLGATSLAYGFGVGFDLDFELALAQRHGVTVHVFDPTPASLAWVESQDMPPHVRFHPIGVAGYDGTAWFEPPRRPTDESYKITGRPSVRAVELEVQRLPVIMQALGHEQLDLLKLDIEGAEYDVIRDMLDSRIQVRQLLVEFHHWFKGVGQEATVAALAMLQRAGFRIFYISPRGHEYSLVRTPPP